MAKFVELRRHTDNDGDALTPEGIVAAVEIGRTLQGPYEVFVSSGAQRATQTAACFIAGMGQTVPVGVRVDDGFRSEMEDRWFGAAKSAAGKTIEDFRRVDPELVETESKRFGAAVRRLLDSLPAGGRALVVGHSPMHECAVWSLTGEVVAPLGKGEGVVLAAEDGEYGVVSEEI